ncbi:MAG: hypothetical protein GTO24_14875 [candidate division Zixibacteria bacterium]|nr:hypothetical protein [candidate division Zixibacteria bacterium]
MISKSIHDQWEKERIENIHDKQSVAERYGWQMVDPLIEMEIDRRNWELREGKRNDFFNSQHEKKANRFLKSLLSSSNSESRFGQLLRKTP